MFSLTEEQRKQFMEQAGVIMENAAGGMSAREIMAGIYAENVEGKTVEEGEAVADKILEAVKSFDIDYGEAKKDEAAFIRKFQFRVGGNKSTAESCTYWLKFIAALSAINSETEIDMDYIEGLSVSEEEATEEYENQLTDEAGKLLMDNGIMLSGLVEYAKNAEVLADGDSAAELLISFGENEFDFRGVAAMLVYSKIQSGEIKNVPEFITPEQAAAITCAEVEREKIFAGIYKGNIAENAAATALKVLGYVVIIHCTSAVLAVSGFEVIASMLISLGVVSILEELFPNVPKKIARTGSLVVSDVVYGARKVARCVKKDILPDIKSKAAKAQEKFAEKLGNIKEKAAEVQYEYEEETVVQS